VIKICQEQQERKVKKEETEELGVIMRRIGTRYVYWYNRKYNRCGHLFQDRYKSELVEYERYFLTVFRKP